jgi:alpha-D-ribose 1-methylphosphonate 5-triphosphate diphosphatase
VVDCEGDFLIPGLIDLHTDALQQHTAPRAGVQWPFDAAVVAHDAQVATAGITTVFDAQSIGVGVTAEEEDRFLERLRGSLAELNWQEERQLRAEHFLHVRLELPHPETADVFEEFADLPLLKMVSMTDHTPGQGQYADVERWRQSFRKSFTDEEFEARLQTRLERRDKFAGTNRNRIAAAVRERGLPLASHDDRTVEDVVCAATVGASISEFPVTLEAAEAATRMGLSVLMGGPNVVLGGSHSGNAAAADVAENGWLDGLTSDYVPSSLLHGAFLLFEQHGFSLPAAVGTVTSAPAAMVRLDDRGSLKPGLRADVVRIRRNGNTPRVIAVWRAGVRVV